MLQSLGLRTISALLALLFTGVLLSAQQVYAATYYVDSASGSDSNDGLSPAKAWRSVRVANSRISGASHDLLLRSGSVFDNQELIIAWSGVSSDWVNVGCYKLSSAGAAQTCSATDAKPEINGTFEPWCAASKQCTVNVAGAAPGSHWNGLISISANYVSVRQIAIRDSAGASIRLVSDAAQKRHDFLIEDLETTNSFREVLLVGSHYKDGIIRGVNATGFDICALYRYEVCQFWPGGLMIHDSPNANIIVENNTVRNGFGEAFNCLRSSHVVFRGNRAGSVHSNPYYLDNCSNTIVENNIAWGDLTGEWGANLAFAGVSINTEDYIGGTLSSTNNVVRNNLITGVGACISSEQWPQSVVKGHTIGFHLYGNSCVASSRVNFVVHSSVVNVDSIVVKNNIFYSPNSTDGSCFVIAHPRISFSHNFWDGRSKDVKCAGLADIQGDPMLVTNLSAFRSFDSKNPPSAKHFALQSGSPVLNRGLALDQSSLVNPDQFTRLSSLIGGDKCPLSFTSLATDYYCVNRQDPPSIGALDRVKYPPKAPVILSVGG